MNTINSDELNFLITSGDKTLFMKIINEIQDTRKIDLNIKLICDKSYKVEDYYDRFYELINDAFSLSLWLEVVLIPSSLYFFIVF